MFFWDSERVFYVGEGGLWGCEGERFGFLWFSGWGEGVGVGFLEVVSFFMVVWFGYRV